MAALRAAVEQYRLVISERVLLERTLHGSIRALTELLALAHPVGFGRASRAKTDMADLTAKLGVADGWLFEIAAMLSQIGCITLPPETAAKVYAGEDLGPVEAQMVERLPEVAAQLLGNIPRLEAVQDMLRYQQKWFDGGGIPADSVHGAAIPWGARALKISLDFDVLMAQGFSPLAALDLMYRRVGRYDPVILGAFAALRRGASSFGHLGHVREVDLNEIGPGMTFAEDIRSPDGTLLFAHGQEVTVSLAARLRNFEPGRIATTSVKIVVSPRSERRSAVTQRLQQEVR
jgi:hypothetical protein